MSALGKSKSASRERQGSTDSANNSKKLNEIQTEKLAVEKHLKILMAHNVKTSRAIRAYAQSKILQEKAKNLGTTVEELKR